MKSKNLSITTLRTVEWIFRGSSGTFFWASNCQSVSVTILARKAIFCKNVNSLRAMWPRLWSLPEQTRTFLHRRPCIQFHYGLLLHCFRSILKKGTYNGSGIICSLGFSTAFNIPRFFRKQEERKTPVALRKRVSRLPLHSFSFLLKFHVMFLV